LITTLPTRPLTYRERLVRLWRSRPDTTVEDAQRLTGAPDRVVRKVRGDLVARGELKAGPWSVWAS